MTEHRPIHPSVRPAFPRPFRGSVSLWPHESSVLAGNPLGDPTARSVVVYAPPDGVSEGRPMIMHLGGFTSSGIAYAQPDGFLQEGLVGLLDRSIRSGELPPMSLVVPNCLTSLGGSQYVDSAATGRYATYVLDELVPWLRERLRPSGVGIMGQSSGGFGALHLAMLRPGLFAAVGSSAGDMAFDLTYAVEFPKAVRGLRTYGGPEEFLRRLAADPGIVSGPTDPAGSALNMIAMASCYSPVGNDGGFELPFDLETGEIVPEVWQRWLRFDPVERLSNDAERAALAGLRSLHLTASRSDEWFLDLGAQRFVERARAHRLVVLHEEFDGGHFRHGPRFAALLRRFGEVLSEGSQR